MGSQALGPKLLRRIARETGCDVVWGSSSGGYVMEFMTADHRHGWWNKKDGSWGIDEGRDWHFTSCQRLFLSDG